ncbi:MAG TPA: PAS domain-containing protein [Victivallales bacterium]|nr:PAS domain-containing protein [Victivallales bacterium]
MKINYTKIKELLRSKKLSITELCSKIGIVRATYWNWYTGKSFPSETKVRLIAKELNVNVNVISDFEPDQEYSDVDLANSVDSWLLIGGRNEYKRIQKQNKLIALIKNMQLELRQSSILTKVLMSSTEAMFYIKDTKLRYIIANDSFLRNVSFNTESNILGMDDKSFFTKQEAEFNSKQDLEVLQARKPIKNFEGFIPGSRKKKWGLISKYPIIDSIGKNGGVVGTFVDITKRKKFEIFRERIEYALSFMDITIWIGKEIKKDKNGFLYLSKMLYKIGGSLEAYYGKPLKEIDKLSDADMAKYRMSVPDEAKKTFTKQINGPYPIIRQFTVKSPYTGITFHTTEHIYYDEKKDIFIGIMNNTKVRNGRPENEAVKKAKENIAEKLRAKGVDESIIKSSLE